MSGITINITTDNAAFVDDYNDEVDQILAFAQRVIANGGVGLYGLLDSNGNLVGRLTIVPPQEED